MSKQFPTPPARPAPDLPPPPANEPLGWPEPNARWRIKLTLGQRVAVALWVLVRRTLFALVPRSWNLPRLMLLRLFGARVDLWTTTLGRGATINFPWNLSIGRGVIVEHGVIFNATARIDIADNARVSQYAHLCTAMRDDEDPRMPLTGKPIRIGRGVWIAADVFVGPGVTIGENTIIGARASVFDDVPPDVIAVGEPARPIKRRDA